MKTATWQRRTKGRGLAVAGLTVALAVAGGAVSAAVTPASAGTPAAAGRDGQLQRDFTAAAREFTVPPDLLLAVSYQLTRWDDHGTAPSGAGGYGLMHLTEVSAADVRAGSGRGGDAPVDAAAIAGDRSLHRLTAAAAVLRVDTERLKREPAMNIRGGAALLAQDARTLSGGALPASLAGWYPAVARFSGAARLSGASAFADDVFETLRTGAARTTNRGQRLSLRKTPVTTPPHSILAHAAPRATAADPAAADGPTPAAECPAGLSCRFIPAAYAWINRADANDYGNYDPADRPADGNKVRYIVIHDTEGSYQSAISTFQDPRTYKSAHYVIRSSDGEITQMVPTKDVAWHAGNWNLNQSSIGIEHEGVAADGATWYTEAMYQSSARLVRWLARRYGVPLDRTHIIGHEDIEREYTAKLAGAHWDPGPFWDWNHFMTLLGAPAATERGAVRAGDIVTVAPDFATNRQAIPGCDPLPCRDLPEQGSNFAFLRTAPRDDAPLINDPALQPTGAPGTRNAEDWSDKAVAGRQYVVADVQGEWVAIWYAGKQAWIRDADRTIVRRSCGGRKVTPRAGVDSIPVYGLAFPEADEYPAGVPAKVGAPLPYTVPKGQSYVAGEVAPAANYYARFDESNVPLNHTVIRGKTVYLRISLNHRWGFVRLSDVEFVA